MCVCVFELKSCGLCMFFNASNKWKTTYYVAAGITKRDAAGKENEIKSATYMLLTTRSHNKNLLQFECGIIL